jgi:hypothetical protein
MFTVFESLYLCTESALDEGPPPGHQLQAAHDSGYGFQPASAPSDPESAARIVVQCRAPRTLNIPPALKVVCIKGDTHDSAALRGQLCA